MSALQIVIDGRETSASEGMTILQVAELLGIQIPTLCHSPDLIPAGVCRVCVVEVEGVNALVGSCHTPIVEGMVVHTHSPKVVAARRSLVELLLAAHTGSCVLDENAGSCALHRLASDLEAGSPRFRARKPRSYPVEDANPYVRRDLSKCILCRKCVRACREIANGGVLGVGYRGFRSKIIVDLDDPLRTQVCRDCGVCIDYCPTGALAGAVSRDAEGVP